MTDKELAEKDMYGDAIIPIGDSGYGVSVAFFVRPDDTKHPYFSIFHESDGFRQSLTSVTIDENGGWISNVFRDRTAEVLGGG